MSGPAARVSAPQYVPSNSEIGIGMLGYGFMGEAHSNAYKMLQYMTLPPPLRPLLVAIGGRNTDAVAEVARRYGFDQSLTDWRAIVADDRVGLFDNTGPNDQHAEPTIAAAEAGKHVFCEKPLGRTAEESFEIWRRVAATGVEHMCGFNYRFVPAVRLAREMIQAGELGEIYHFRGRYLQEWVLDPGMRMAWRLQKALAGSGALGDLGAHVIDMARFLLGQEISSVSGMIRTFSAQRAGGRVDVDDAFEAMLEFDGGAIGEIGASRVCPGRKNAFTWEVNGTKGSVAFDLERLNELQVYLGDSEPGARAQGFRQVLVTESYHPFLEHWWPQGHMLGWEHTFVHEIHHMLQAIAGEAEVRPYGGDFEDGYKAATVCDAVTRSAETGCRERVSYRSI